MRRRWLTFIALSLCLIFALFSLNAASQGQDTPKAQSKRVVIRFSVEISDYTVGQLMGFIDSKRIEGKDEFVILMSSPGGTVHAGLTIYNYLKALPSKVTTCNFGSVDSIGIVMYCGGSTRLSVPQARFLIHGPKISVNGPIVFDEKELDETLKGLRIDSDNIAKVMAANTNRSFGDVKNAMFERTTLTPEQAKLWGLVHEIKSELYDSTDYVYHVDTKP